MAEYKPKILAIEDDPTLGFILKDKLQDAGYDVIHCTDGESGFQQFMKHNFDMILMDIMLPKKDGIAIVSQIRKKNNQVPIIMLTSKNMDNDKISGFESGADDYVTKPFNMQELLLRMNVHLKRTMKTDEGEAETFQLGNLNFVYNELMLTNGTVQMQLTQREADLLRYFCLNANKVLKRDDILLHVWGKDDYFLGRSMDVFITKIRKYLKDQPNVNLQTIHGIGFKFNAEIPA
ncbi:MAG TPA: response regulator transcription factor [Flavipsychrobacter sp.]|nr:response regulator transcription factor [Flavipsychrobacter sp.]